MSREDWVGTKVRVYFGHRQWIVGVVERTPAYIGDTWDIVGDKTNYAVQQFAYMESLHEQDDG